MKKIKDIQNLLKTSTGEIPDKPGVYIFLNDNDRYLYVGKAKNLNKRVSQYFRNNSLHGRIEEVLQNANRVEWIITNNEIEALLLEAKLIRLHSPKYNIKLLENDPYGGIAIDEKNAKMFLWRGKRPTGCKTFGPFPGVRGRVITDSLSKAFGLRSCNDKVYKRHSIQNKPCLLGEIGNCVAPCLSTTKKEVIKNSLDSTINFLEGRKAQTLYTIKTNMEIAAKSENYELAARKRDQYIALEKLANIQNVNLNSNVSLSVVDFSHEDDLGILTIMVVSNGEMQGMSSYQVEIDPSQEEEDNLSQALISIISTNIIYHNKKMIITSDLPVTFSENIYKEYNIKLLSKQNKKYAPLIEMVKKNNMENLPYILLKENSRLISRQLALSDLSATIGVKSQISRIECIDISHTQGKFPVASLVVSLDGRPHFQDYKKFHLPPEIGGSDTDSIYEAVYKRFTGSKMGLKGYPDLLIIDGGAPQVNVASKALNEIFQGSDLNIPVIGLAKRMEEIFLPHQSNPVILSRDSQALKIAQKIRDEAHRFAISSHKKIRDKDIVDSYQDILKNVDGLGNKKLKILLSGFNDISSLYQATQEEISSIQGIGSALGKKIHQALHNI